MKVGIVGAGYVGSTAAYALVMRGVGREVVLVDKNADRAVAEADDLRHAVPFANPLEINSGDYDELTGCRVVVLCAGVGQKRGETEFLANLFTEELNTQDHTDAVIFAGPKAMLESGVPQESLKKVAEVEFPVFYMNYNLDPQAVPWRDAIGNAVKYLRGVEYTIARPRDLWNAWGDIMSRIVKLKLGKRAANGATH